MDHLTPLSESICLDQPRTPATTLIIICTWLGGATPRRISKYTTGYRTHYPDASILLITTTVATFAFRSSHTVHTLLTPARETIRTLLHTHTQHARILLHVFSNGGSSIATELVQSMRTLGDPGDWAQFTAALKLIVFDCCPGDSSFQRYYKAAATSLPQTALAQRVGKPLLYPAIGVIVGLQKSGVMKGIDALRRDLNEVSLFGTGARRLYLYSQGDEMVHWRAVEAHTEAARAKGYVVEGVRFDTGSHCALVLADAKTYWGVIQRGWEGTALDMLLVPSRL